MRQGELVGEERQLYQHHEDDHQQCQQALLEAAHARVRDTLTTQRAVLEALAKLLMEREVVDRASLDELLARTRRPARDAGSRSANGSFGMSPST